jgi:hypothetical protein
VELVVAHGLQIELLGALSARIDEELKKRGPMWMLQRWEQASAAAGGEVVGELAAIASGSEGEPDKWREAWSRAMLRIMHSCASEFVGDTGMSTGAGAFKAFCHSIIPLHGDKLEGRVAMPCPDLEEAAKDLVADDCNGSRSFPPRFSRCFPLSFAVSRWSSW